MARNKPLLFLVVLCCFALSSCNLHRKTGGGGGGGGNIGAVAVTMVADTLPANPSLLSFRVTIASIKFTTSSGTSTTVNLNPALSVDLMRLQSDTVFLGTFGSMPVAQYTSVTLVLSGNANITFLNDTGATLSGCASNNVCPLSVAASSNPVATVSYSVAQNLLTGIGIDLNFANAVSISSGSLVVNFSNNNVLSGFTLPRANSHLASGQLDLIEDFTGVVTINSQSATLASASATGRGSLTALAVSGTIFDHDPSNNLCQAGTNTLSSCVANNQFASMDVILKSDGTLAIQEIEPLLATVQDTVEGIVVSINPANQTQFTMIVTDLVPLATNSLIGSLHIGDGLTVNLSGSVNPFLVDTKGLPVQSQFGSIFQNFFGQTSTTAIHLGQSIAVHVIAPFTAAAGTTIASATTDTVTLRWSRFTATPQTAASPAFSIVNPPSYFAIAQGTSITVQTTPGTPGTPGVTNFDGITDSTGLNLAANHPVALRALFLENAAGSANPALFAAKVRQQ
jgi:hypothetical protein